MKSSIVEAINQSAKNKTSFLGSIDNFAISIYMKEFLNVMISKCYKWYDQ